MPGHRRNYHYDATELDNETYSILKDYVKEHGYAPSLNEFSDMLSISPSSARQRLTQLEKKHKLRYLGTCMKIEFLE